MVPPPASCQQLLADANLTPLYEPPAVLDRWAAAAESLQGAAGMIQTARANAKNLGPLLDGEAPAAGTA
ncbi:hypothetical protein [Streptomyces sp. NPDC127114]|uniref:hypothetical protein n=1 Tax=Streptomyces sp. NPDC127114 TaxID=3345366 RepID=UPI0036408C18